MLRNTDRPSSGLTGRQGSQVVRDDDDLRHQLKVSHLPKLAHGRALRAYRTTNRTRLCIRTYFRVEEDQRKGVLLVS